MYKKAFILIKYAFNTARIGKMMVAARWYAGAEQQRLETSIKDSGRAHPRTHPAQDEATRWQVGTGPEAKGRRNAPCPRGFDVRRS